MDTSTIMEESREITMKIDSDEYLEEFRVNICFLYHSKKERLLKYLGIKNY
jgi:hypothetical protein